MLGQSRSGIHLARVSIGIVMKENPKQISH